MPRVPTSSSCHSSLVIVAATINLNSYYLWDIEESKPIILVREGQFEDLLSEINLQLDLGLKITDSQREEGLVVHILDHPRCRPRYLGRSRSRTEYDSMVSDVPGVAVRPVDESVPPPLNEQLIEDFKLMVQDAWQATKNKSKAMKEKKRVDRLQKLKVVTDQFKRAQRYLGLRPTAVQGERLMILGLSRTDSDYRTSRNWSTTSHRCLTACSLRIRSLGCIGMC